MRIHPSFGELNRLADRELDASRQREVHEHLGGCQRCRDQVALMRDLGRAAREISHPSPPDDALSRILERRAAGDRVILPVMSALRASRRRKTIGIAAGIGGALLAATLLLLPTSDASAGASDLRFDPAQPEPGDQIDITYVPSSALAPEEVLYLRGAFRRAGDPLPRRELPGAFRVELLPKGDGTFSGSLHMPPDVVFGYFVVENESASEIDLNDGRFWALLAHDDGIPTRESLREQLQVVDQTDVAFGLIATRMLLDTYPDDVVGWNRRLAYEQKTTVGEALVDVLATHREKLVELSRARDQRGTGGLIELEGLWRYARRLEHAALQERWATQLLLENDRPETAEAARIRLAVELQDAETKDPLEAYEREWMLAGLSQDYIVAQAFRRALEGDDTEAILRWARRHIRVHPAEVDVIVQSLDRSPALRDLAKRGIRTEVRRLETPSPERRLLGETSEELLARDRQRISLLLGTLGRLLFEEDRFAAAIDTLERAVELGWNPDVFRSLAEAYAAMGDVAEALTLYAYVVAGERDVAARRELVSSLQRRFGRLFPEESAWSVRVAEATAEIDQRLITDAGQPITPAGNPLVRKRNGESQSLESLVADRISIVLFWAGSPSDPDIDLIANQAALRALEAQGVAVITITETPHSPDLETILEDEGFELDVYFDHEWEAHRSLKSDGIPYFFVVDLEGRFLFAEDIAQAIRLAESLKRTAAPAA